MVKVIDEIDHVHKINETLSHYFESRHTINGD